MCSARISSMVRFLISFFAIIFLVFCDVNVCFFFDGTGIFVNWRDLSTFSNVWMILFLWTLLFYQPVSTPMPYLSKKAWACVTEISIAILKKESTRCTKEYFFCIVFGNCNVPTISRFLCSESFEILRSHRLLGNCFVFHVYNFRYC